MVVVVEEAEDQKQLNTLHQERHYLRRHLSDFRMSQGHETSRSAGPKHVAPRHRHDSKISGVTPP